MIDSNKNNHKANVNTRYITVSDWGKYHDWPRIGGLRHLIFNKSTNGFDQFDVVKKVGRRVLIDETAFFNWLSNQGKSGD